MDEGLTKAIGDEDYSLLGNFRPEYIIIPFGE